MMIDPATRSVFAALRQLIPEIPERCKRVELILSTDSPPQVCCDFIIRDSVTGKIKEDHKRYILSENKL